MNKRFTTAFSLSTTLFYSYLFTHTKSPVITELFHHRLDSAESSPPTKSCLYALFFIPFISPHTKPSHSFLFCYIYMYGTFTHSKLLRRLPHRSLMLDNISCDFYRPLFNILFHKNPCIICLLNSMLSSKRVYTMFAKQDLIS